MNTLKIALMALGLAKTSALFIEWEDKEIREVEVNIGSSDEKRKTVKVIPGLVCPYDVNKDNWTTSLDRKDTFRITVEGDEVTATRTDKKSRWGIDLKFNCHLVHPNYNFVGEGRCRDAQDVQPIASIYTSSRFGGTLEDCMMHCDMESDCYGIQYLEWAEHCWLYGGNFRDKSNLFDGPKTPITQVKFSRDKEYCFTRAYYFEPSGVGSGRCEAGPSQLIQTAEECKRAVRSQGYAVETVTNVGRWASVCGCSFNRETNHLQFNEFRHPKFCYTVPGQTAAQDKDSRENGLVAVCHAKPSSWTRPPTGNPTPMPTSNPTPRPTSNPTHKPTSNPTPKPIDCSTIRDSRHIEGNTSKGKCRHGYRRLTLEQAKQCRDEICTSGQMSDWGIFSIEGGTIDGPGYGCNVVPKVRATGSEMCIPVAKRFTLRGRSGTEQYRILNAKTRSVIATGVLPTTEKSFEILAENSVIIEFQNDNGPRDIYFRSDEPWEVHHGYMNPNSWNCGGSGRTDKERCDRMQSGDFAWKGEYTVTFRVKYDLEEETFIKFDECPQSGGKTMCKSTDYEECALEAREACNASEGCMAVAVYRLEVPTHGGYILYTDLKCNEDQKTDDRHWDLYTRGAGGRRRSEAGSNSLPAP